MRKTNVGPVVEDHSVEWHGKEEKRVGWRRSHTLTVTDLNP